MHYNVITFDTQTVETNSFHFDGGFLSQLKQFKDGPVRIVLSEIVVREIFKHLVEKTRGAKDAAIAAHKKATDYGLAWPGGPFVPDATDIKAVAQTRLNRFLQEIGAEIIRPNNVPMADLVAAYFQPSPPFSAGGKNKAEFPDAIALLSLERWAKENNLKVLGVSGDKGWHAYAEINDWIDLHKELADALSLLQKHAEEAHAVAQQLLRSINSNAAPELAQTFEKLLANELSSYDAYGEGDSFYELEPDHVELELIEFRFSGDEENYDFALIQSAPHTLVVEIEMQADVVAETTFYMSIYDSIDKDYTPAGSTVARTEAELSLKVLATFERDDVSAQFDIAKIEIVKGPNSINFGFVEPDFEPEPEENYEMPDDFSEERDDQIPI